MEYMIVESFNTCQLMKDVNKKLEEGWEVVGGVTKRQEGYQLILLQTLIYKGEEKMKTINTVWETKKYLNFKCPRCSRELNEYTFEEKPKDCATGEFNVKCRFCDKKFKVKIEAKEK